MKRKANKSKPPSRVRYEQTHPTISMRVSRELYDRLDAVRIGEGKSWGDVWREALKVQQRTANRAYNRGLNDGLARGREEGEATAKAKYLVTFRCSGCGGPTEVSSDNVRAAVREYLEQQRWGHSRCVRRA